MPEDFKGTISYFNPSSHYSTLPIHARMVEKSDSENKEDHHYAMCHGNMGLPVLSFGEDATPDKVTCRECLRMLESGFRYERHNDDEDEEQHWY